MKGFSSLAQKRVVTFLFYFAILYKFCDAFSLQTHGDPFYYHLAGAKTLFFHGLKVLMHDLQIYAQAGIFDLFYILPYFFTHNPIVIQITGQLMHLGASLFLAVALFMKWIPNRVLGLLGAIALLTISRDSAFFIYAKNDGVVAVATLWACYEIHKRKSPLWIGFALGLIPSIKMSGLLSSAVLGVMYAVLIFRQNRGLKRFTPTLQAGGAALLTFLPVLIKNYVMTGNPFFPGMVHLFPGTLSEATQSVYTMYFSTKATLGSVLLNTKELFFGKLVYLLAFVIAPYKIKKRDYNGLIFFSAGILIFFAHAATNGVPQGARFFFATYFLLLFFTFSELAKLKYNPKWNWALLALILIDSKIEMAPRTIVGNFRELATHSREELLDRHIVQWKFLKFLDPNPTQVALVYSDRKVEYFHLHPLYRFVHPELSKDSDFMRRCDQANDVAKLDAFKYFLLIDPLQNPCYAKIRQKGKLVAQPLIDDNNARVDIYEKNW